MIVEPQLAVTTVLEWLREVAIIGSILLLGWKSRGVFQSVIDFQKEVCEFMRDMRGFAHRVETNHLRHVEKYLKEMARTAVGEDIDVETDPTEF